MWLDPRGSTYSSVQRVPHLDGTENLNAVKIKIIDAQSQPLKSWEFFELQSYTFPLCNAKSLRENAGNYFWVRFLLKGQSSRERGGKLKTHVGPGSTVTPAVRLPALAPGPTALTPSTTRRTEVEKKKKKKNPETLEAAFQKATLRTKLGSSSLVPESTNTLQIKTMQLKVPN